MQPGTCLGDRYTLEEHIGTSEHGSVWFGRDTVVDRPVRIKVLDPLLARDEEVRSRFWRTAMAMAELDVPGIVDVYDCVEQRDGDEVTVCQISERLEEETLRKVLIERSLDPEDALSLVAGLGWALQSAHEAGLRHSNLKSSNLIVGPDSSVTIVDFGFSGTGAVADDVFALGAIAYECVTGALPFVVVPDVPPVEAERQPLSLPANLAPAVAAFVKRALSTDPEVRFGSAAILATECEQITYTNDVLGPLLERGVTELDGGSAAAATPVLEPGAGPLPHREAEAAPDAPLGRRVARAAPSLMSQPKPEPAAAVKSKTEVVPKMEAAPKTMGGKAAPEPVAASPSAPEPVAEPEPAAAKAALPPPPKVRSKITPEFKAAPVPAPAAEPTTRLRDAAAAPPVSPPRERKSRKRLVLVAALLLLIGTAGAVGVSTLTTDGSVSATDEGGEPAGGGDGGNSETDSGATSSEDAESQDGDKAGNDPSSAESSGSSSASDDASPSDGDEPDDNDDPAKVSVPNVVGQHPYKAYQTLKNAGLKVNAIESGKGDHACPVTDQSPDGGASVNEGSTVDIMFRMVRDPDRCDGNGGGGDDHDDLD